MRRIAGIETNRPRSYTNGWGGNNKKILDLRSAD